jgi:aminopeptidase YwaD
MATLQDLAGFGEKRVGTPGGAKAGDYVKQRLQQAGLPDVREEPFDFPRYDLTSSSFALTVDGQALAIGHDVFEAAGAGHADADVVDVGTALPDELAGKDLAGKIALVQRNRFFHRSSQLVAVAAKGAIAMLYVSITPANTRQVGSVRKTWEPITALPAITIGADDGAKITDAAKAGKKVHATIDVAAQTSPASGRNLLGTIQGTDPQAGAIAIGAHYDTWFTGSTDNGGGTSGVLALAARRMQEKRPKATLVFVLWDGEEVGLYGGYHFLRKHKIEHDDGLSVVLNFEVPSAKDAPNEFIARSDLAAVDDALRFAGLAELYPTFSTLGAVPALFGGIIPTDVQGIYRGGIATAFATVDSPYYHTSEDTPDKVDVGFLAQAVDRFDKALAAFMDVGPTCCSAPDPEIWKAEATVAAGAAGLTVDATITDAGGKPQGRAPASATLLYDDFFPGATVNGATDDAGMVRFQFSATDSAKGRGRRFVHVTAGPQYPLVERVLAVP